jgi:hypothetical protein
LVLRFWLFLFAVFGFVVFFFWVGHWMLLMAYPRTLALAFPPGQVLRESARMEFVLHYIAIWRLGQLAMRA